MPALAMNDLNRAETAPVHLSRPASGIIAAFFFGYLAVGLPLPVIPLFVHDKLGFSNPIVGLVIGVQFLATVLTRGYAGRLTDQHGGRRSVLQGAAVCALGGLFYLIAAMPGLSPAASLAVVVLGRLAAGFGESQLVTGCVSWSIASVGPQRAGMSMYWTGIAMFAALAIGAPIGMALYQGHGLQSVMIACVLAPLIAAVIALRETSYGTPAGQRLPFYRVIGQIWREGFGLMLSGVGLSGLTAFASLYFTARSWGHAGLVMTAFGVGFIFVRLVLGSLPDRMSGYRVAFWSLVIEAIGQTMIWGVPYEIAALAGALVTGLGCALVFPALGVEALKRAPPANRGTRWGRSSPSSTSLTVSRVPSRASLPGSSATPPFICSVGGLGAARPTQGEVSCHASSFPARPPVSASWLLNCSSAKVTRSSCTPATPIAARTLGDNCRGPKRS